MILYWKFSYEGIGYQPLIDYGDWRVAILRYRTRSNLTASNP
jgi:hypothetical protein